MDEPTPAVAPERRCEWCSAGVPADAPICPGCGATMPNADATSEPYYPGVTDVHPRLKAAAEQPLRVPGASPTGTIAPSVFRLAAQAGPAGVLVGLGAVAAMAAAEWMGAERHRADTAAAFIDGLGQPAPQPDRDLRAALEQLDGRWQAPAPSGEEGLPPASGGPAQSVESAESAESARTTEGT
jgi:hypothetical protein